MNQDQEKSTQFTIFGFTGDLAAKKIIPSLWHLFQEKRLPKNFQIIGFARRQLSQEEVNKLIHASVSSHVEEEIDQEAFHKFCALFSYVQGDFQDPKSYLTLQEHLIRLVETSRNGSNKLYYLSVPPDYYPSILNNLASAGLNQQGDETKTWTRILIEKPFGSNAKTAKDLQQLLTNHFKEDQIFRIDHYLFKEIIQGIENFRFSNNLFENTWDNTTIESIELKLYERCWS